MLYQNCFSVVVYGLSVGEYITKVRVGALKHDVPDHIFFTFMYTGCLVFFKNFILLSGYGIDLGKDAQHIKMNLSFKIFYHLII